MSQAMPISSPADVREARECLKECLLGSGDSETVLAEEVARNLKLLRDTCPGNNAFWQTKRVARQCLLACHSRKQFRAVRRRLIRYFGEEVVQIASACRHVRDRQWSFACGQKLER